MGWCEGVGPDNMKTGKRMTVSPQWTLKMPISPSLLQKSVDIDLRLCDESLLLPLFDEFVGKQNVSITEELEVGFYPWVL